MFLSARLISFLDPTLAWWPSTRIVWEISNPARCHKNVALAILFCTCIPRLVSDGAKEGWRISWIMESSLTMRTVKYPDGSLGLSTMRHWRGSVAQKNTWQTLPLEYLTWMQPSLPLLSMRRKYLPGFWSGFDLSWRGASWDCWEALTPNLGLPHLPSHRLRFYWTHNLHHSLTASYSDIRPLNPGACSQRGWCALHSWESLCSQPCGRGTWSPTGDIISLIKVLHSIRVSLKGVTRLSFMHYNTLAEVDRVVDIVDAACI